MKNLILKLVSALTIMLSLSACSDLKKEVTIRTIGGEKRTLKIKAPKEFKKDKELYFVMYTGFYMEQWNAGVDGSKNPKREYQFDLERFLKGSVGSLQGNPYIIDDMEEYLKNKKGLTDKFMSDGRDFANKHPQKRVDAKKEEIPETHAESQENKSEKTYRSFWPKVPRREKTGESSE